MDDDLTLSQQDQLEARIAEITGGLEITADHDTTPDLATIQVSDFAAVREAVAVLLLATENPNQTLWEHLVEYIPTNHQSDPSLIEAESIFSEPLTGDPTRVAGFFQRNGPLKEALDKARQALVPTQKAVLLSISF